VCELLQQIDIIPLDTTAQRKLTVMNFIGDQGYFQAVWFTTVFVLKMEFHLVQ